ncbi:hypothetical protein BMR10_06335 [Methylococcaceae bacterium CS4]|nr:hypothetical protein BMR10_06335 [Methylococcaceae bacterium CS4]
MRTIKKLGIAMLFILMFSVSGGAYSAPAGTNQLRLQTGFSKRTGETAFSYLVTWRKGEEDLKDINGLMFVNGTETISPTTDAKVAYKITKALNMRQWLREPH